uniref:Pre-rRNA-processing protein TSR1 homolog n=1 Tax=Panagrolaimus superbus TaxID=310955 RepID=A0A914YDT3_9BILA
MSTEQQQAHRPGPFKLPNKAHKAGRHRTKGQVDRDCRGRKDVKTLSIRTRRDLNRTERRKALRSTLKNQRKKLVEQNRNLNRAPTLVTIISFNAELDAARVVEKLAACDPESQSVASERGNITYLHVPRFRGRYGFVCPLTTHLDNVLDCLKVSDVVLFVWPLEEDLTETQSLLMSTILAHGLPSSINVVGDIPSKGKQRDQLRHTVLQLIDSWSLNKDKIYDLDTDANALQLLRQIQGIRKRPTVLQRRRPHLMVEKMEPINVRHGLCTLKLTGFLRGPHMDANKLIHIQGLGDFQLEQIDRLKDSLPGAKGSNEEVVVLKPDENQIDLNTEVIPDPMDAEQPNVDDMLKAEVFTTEKETKLVPKGTSSYQAEWIVNDDEEENDDDDEEDDDDSMEDESDEDNEDEFAPTDLKGPGFYENEGMDIDQMTVAGTEGGEFDDMDIDKDDVKKYRKERENEQFPDEIDTPMDQPAAVRFQKYRGLKSFRTSPWDPKENLPLDYARIFKFGNIKHTKKLILKELENEPENGKFVTHGDYVSFYVKDVPAHIVNEWGMDMPMIVYGLLKHEQRMSVLNVVLRRHFTCNLAIKNKANLIYHVGYRRFEANGIFSQHTNGDKFKMERFMPNDNGPFVSTMFAPICFGPANVLVFYRDENGAQHLVASGSVLDMNPDRVILKRVVLSGHISKVNRRLAIVRYMFFNRDDIEWFKPVELYTPQGRRGHIKESLGTHGHIKCLFDQSCKFY